MFRFESSTALLCLGLIASVGCKSSSSDAVDASDTHDAYVATHDASVTATDGGAPTIDASVARDGGQHDGSAQADASEARDGSTRTDGSTVSIDEVRIADARWKVAVNRYYEADCDCNYASYSFDSSSQCLAVFMQDLASDCELAIIARHWDELRPRYTCFAEANQNFADCLGVSECANPAAMSCENAHLAAIGDCAVIGEDAEDAALSERASCP